MNANPCGSGPQNKSEKTGERPENPYIPVKNSYKVIEKSSYSY
jgi:hypothetical protein